MNDVESAEPVARTQVVVPVVRNGKNPTLSDLISYATAKLKRLERR